MLFISQNWWVWKFFWHVSACIQRPPGFISSVRYYIIMHVFHPLYLYASIHIFKCNHRHLHMIDLYWPHFYYIEFDLTVIVIFWWDTSYIITYDHTKTWIKLRKLDVRPIGQFIEIKPLFNINDHNLTKWQHY